MKNVPLILIYSRLAIGLMMICLSILNVDYYKQIAIVLLTIGLLTDIFDGIIARRLNVSSQKLRRLDSSINQIFFISMAISTYIQCPDFFKNNSIKLVILFGFEGLTYLVCFIKFKKRNCYSFNWRKDLDAHTFRHFNPNYHSMSINNSI